MKSLLKSAIERLLLKMMIFGYKHKKPIKFLLEKLKLKNKLKNFKDLIIVKCRSSNNINQLDMTPRAKFIFQLIHSINKQKR